MHEDDQHIALEESKEHEDTPTQECKDCWLLFLLTVSIPTQEYNSFISYTVGNSLQTCVWIYLPRPVHSCGRAACIINEEWYVWHEVLGDARHGEREEEED